MKAELIAREEPFAGRYLPSRRLATGGMAEIYLARQLSLDGFDKDVVIKRLKPELVHDRRILDMFMDEGRIGGLLNHPNIVHVYDVGIHEGVPFIAMEHILGEELHALCRRGLAVGKFLPLGHAVQLIRQAAIAMGYFHAFRDGDGRGLEIVHCDISPTNLLVTADGFLKVIDFGIAQARGGRYRDERALPGKLSYMSPEQAARGALDARSDVFALGVVLYEITVGRRLFKGPAHEVFDRLARGDIQPPTFVRREFPGHLESIIMRALEHEPAERYQSAYDLADALEEFLALTKLKSGPVRIARYLDELAVAVGGEPRPELIAEAEKVSRDEPLDFDRGLFDGFVPAAEVQGTATEWDEFDEDSQAVADALGVDVSLVKTAGRSEVAALAPGADPAAEPAPADPAASRPAAQPTASRPAAQPTASRPAAQAAASPARPAAARPPAAPSPGGLPPLVLLAVGVALGLAAGWLLGLVG